VQSKIPIGYHIKKQYFYKENPYEYFFSFILLLFSGTALAEGLINIEVLIGKVSILVPKNFGGVHYVLISVPVA